MIIEILKDAILQNIGSLKSAPKNWHKRNCPLCHTQGHGRDTRNRFGIQFNPNSIAVHCFNCGFSAGCAEGKDLSKSFKFFLQQINIDQKFIQQIEFEIFRERNKLTSITEGAVTEEDKESKFRKLFQKWQKIDLPEGSLPITEWLEHGLDDPHFLQVVEYAISRKIYDLDKFYWCPQKAQNLRHRLIIPYFYKKNIVGFTARLSYDTDDKSIPKYFQQVPLDFVYNLDNQQDWSRKYCIVNEGVLDAWSVDGISTLGEISQAQIDVINRLQKTVIACPDRDLKGAEFIEAAIANNWGVAFPEWERGIKDAAKASEKYGRLLTTHSIISSVVYGELNIRNHWKLKLRISSEAEKKNKKVSELEQALRNRIYGK